MIVDRADVPALQARHAQASERIVGMSKLIAGAAPVMDGLTRSPEWERFCTILQGMAEQYKNRKAVAQQKLGDPRITNDDEVRKLRQDIFVADVSMSTLQFAIELPAAILKGKEDADQFISQFEKKNENTSGQSQS